MQEIDGINYVRVSELNTFIECNAKFYFQSIERVEVPNKLSLAGGTSIHATLEKQYLHKLQTRENISVVEAKDVFSSRYDEEIERVDKSDFDFEKPGVVKDAWMEVLDIYFDKVAYRVFPVAVERKVKVKLKGIELGLTGTCDVKDEDGIIVDHKTTAKPYTQTPENYLLQVGGGYCLLDSVLPEKEQIVPLKGARIDYLIRRSPKNKVPAVRHIEVPVDINYFVEVFKHTSKAITAGAFIPNRQHIYCSKRFCKFWNECEKKYKGKVKE